ncbi:MAG TPA: hypothetical protein VJ725_17585 [Thermoanaerobaculia bacterium]|nr:hypothetical protein [Thermoanaerobaculia bacterium]
MFWQRALTISVCLILAFGTAQAGDLSGNCRAANQPSATLLIPYFEVNLDDTTAQTTLFSVNNASAKPALARVVLWTDWGVPTLAFDIYLTGYDVQTINVRDLFKGVLPGTGNGVSNVGSLSETGNGFTGCTSGTNVAPGLSATEQAWLRSAHTGLPLPGSSTPQCAGSGSLGTSIATGYVTIDTVNRCTPRTLSSTVNTPADPAYFVDGGTGLASNSNVLWGDIFQVNSKLNTAESQTAVTILADADFFGDGDYTFYGRYHGFDSRDNRVPLSSLYYARYMQGGVFSGGTDVVVWRDNRSANVSPASCGTSPKWTAPGELQLFAFDEEENPQEIPNANAFPLATQKVAVGSEALPVPNPFGWLMIDLWHRDETHAQGWVGVVMTAEGRFSAGHEAVRADDLCNFGI